MLVPSKGPTAVPFLPNPSCPVPLMGLCKDYLSSNVKIKRFVIVKYGEIADWDVSNVTNMEEMFYFEGGEFFISGSAV